MNYSDSPMKPALPQTHLPEGDTDTQEMMETAKLIQI